MEEGYWMNWKTRVIVPIFEHERDIRLPTTAKKLGLTTALTRQFGRYVLEKDRGEFLFWLMKKAPLMRIRGHGLSVTFQYAAASDRLPHAAIRKWTKETVGKDSVLILNIENLQTGSRIYAPASEFMMAKGPEHQGCKP